MKFLSRVKQALTPKKAPLPLQEKQIQIKQTMRRTKTGGMVPVQAHQKLMMVRPEDIPTPKPPPKEAEHGTTRPQAAPAVPEKEREPKREEPKPLQRPADSGKSPVTGGGVRGGRYAAQNLSIGRENLTQYAEVDHVSKILPGLVDPSKKFRLYKHQADAVNLMTEKFESGSKAFMLADGTGGGKTMTQLAYAAMQAKQGKSAIIVTQDARIIDNFKTDGGRLGIEIDDDQEATPTPGKIHITTYDRLDKLKNVNFDNVIFDESHNLKNVYAGKSMQGKELIKQSGRVLLASATPMDKPEHVKYICDAFGLDHGDVLEDIGYSRGEDEWERQENARETAMRIGSLYDGLTELGLMVKREVSMSNVAFKSKELPLLPHQKKVYDDMAKQMKDDVAKAERTGKNPGMVKSKHLMRIRRYLEDVKVDHAVEAAMQSIQQGRQPVIFATRISDMEISPGQKSPSTVRRIEEELTKRGVPCASLHGASGGDAKQKIADFNEGRAKAFITTYQSGGTGINLDDTTGKSPRDQIHMTPPFSANESIQAIGRTNRVSTKSKSRCLYLTTDTDIDRWNKAIVENKMKTLGAAVGGDYQKLSVSEIEAASNMSDSDAYDFIVGGKKANADTIRIPQGEHRSMSAIIDLRQQLRGKRQQKAAPSQPKPVVTSTELKRWEDLKQHIPKVPGGSMPDFNVTFGEFRGKRLSQLDKEDLQDVLSHVADEDFSKRYVKMLKFHDPAGVMKAYQNRPLVLWI